MIIYLAEPNGRFVGELRGTPEQILAQIPEGYQTTNLIPPRNTDYFNGTNWVDIGPAPAWYFQFDYDVKQWLDKRDLAETKQKKWEQIKLTRNSLEQSGFVFDGHFYDSDMVSQMRISSAAFLGSQTIWMTQNNEMVELNATELNGLKSALATHINSLHERARSARQLIDSCTTVDQVDAVNF